MKIDVSELLKQHGASKEVDYVKNIDAIDYNYQTVEFSNPVKLSGNIINNGQLLVFTGDLQTKIKATCDKCLEQFDYALSINFEEKFSNTVIDDDVTALEDNSIEIDNIINDIIVLNLPLQFACSDNCKGLCSICGGNKNLKECDCYQEDIDPRLLVLKDLLK